MSSDPKLSIATFNRNQRVFIAVDNPTNPNGDVSSDDYLFSMADVGPALPPGERDLKKTSFGSFISPDEVSRKLVSLAYGVTITEWDPTNRCRCTDYEITGFGTSFHARFDISTPPLTLQTLSIAVNEGIKRVRPTRGNITVSANELLALADLNYRPADEFKKCVEKAYGVKLKLGRAQRCPDCVEYRMTKESQSSTFRIEPASPENLVAAVAKNLGVVAIPIENLIFMTNETARHGRNHYVQDLQNVTFGKPQQGPRKFAGESLSVYEYNGRTNVYVGDVCSETGYFSVKALSDAVAKLTASQKN